MKKYIRPLGTALVLALLAAGAYAVSADDSLISLSYLRDTFFPKAVQTGGQSADQVLQGVYENALDELDAIHSAAVNGGGGGSGTAITATPSSLEAGPTVRPSPCPPAPAS